MSNNTQTLESNDNLKQTTSTIPFMIPNYITNLILPKCIMIHGEVIASIYLQLALNINHRKISLHWQKNGCWMQAKRLSTNTGYNVRTISNALKILENLKLIKSKKHGKLNIHMLQNNKLTTITEIKKFNYEVESILLKELNKTKTHKYTTLFQELETTIGINKMPQNQQLIKGTWFSDVHLLRDLVIKSEHIYKGSSLFFINNIAPYLFKTINKQEQSLLFSISEQNRAIRLGSSQSTISRYINSYIDAGYLSITEGNINMPNKIGINLNILDDKNKKRVVNVMSNEKKLTCPICQKDFNENRSLSVHIAKTRDPKHILLNHLKKQTNYNVEEIDKLYLEYKDDFDELNDINEVTKSEVKKPDDNYLKIACNCKMSCKECHRNWKLDFYNDCTHERKLAFIEEYQLEEKEKLKEDFEVVKPIITKKGPGQDTAPGLVKYFYQLINKNSLNWGKEGSQVKNLLKKGISPEDIRITMDYLARRGNIDLRFLNRSIQEALLEKQYLNDMEKEGTEAYLVKMYYNGLNIPVNIQTLVRDVQKIKETMNTGLNYEQTKIVIQYMIDVKCPTLNFIGSKRTEALTKSNKINNGKNNPSFFDRDDLVIVQNELKNGRTNLRKISDKYKSQAQQIALKLFRENGFSTKYTHLEWAWKIGLELNAEMYELAINMQQKQEFALDKLLRDPSITDEQRAAVLKIKDNFNKWLTEQEKLFQGSVKIN